MLFKYRMSEKIDHLEKGLLTSSLWDTLKVVRREQAWVKTGYLLHGSKWLWNWTLDKGPTLLFLSNLIASLSTYSIFKSDNKLNPRFQRLIIDMEINKNIFSLERWVSSLSSDLDSFCVHLTKILHKLANRWRWSRCRNLSFDRSSGGLWATVCNVSNLTWQVRDSYMCNTVYDPGISLLIFCSFIEKNKEQSIKMIIYRLI